MDFLIAYFHHILWRNTVDDVISTVLYLFLWVCDFMGQTELCSSIRGRVEWSGWPQVQLLNADSDMLQAFFVWLRLKAVAFRPSMDKRTHARAFEQGFCPPEYPFAKLYCDKVPVLSS